MARRRLAVLYSEPGSYTQACLRTLRDSYGWEILAIHYPTSKDAPFAQNPLRKIAKCVDRTQLNSAAEITDCVRHFGAEILQIAGWMDRGYLAAARQLRKLGIPVIAGSDTQYSGSLRQKVASVVSPWYLKNAIDVLWVTGERQRVFADKLGYRGRLCWTGMYCCDFEKFALAGKSNARNPTFLFVGRYVEAKGLDVLVRAYREYRMRTPVPWRLQCVGTGPLKSTLRGIEGLDDLGFVQPDELPEIMSHASVFVLPSRKEPWGVVVQEAAAAGLPIICSDAVGASVHLVREGFNGFTFLSESVGELTDRMLEISAMPEEHLDEMSRNGRSLASQYTPELWARTLVNGVEQLLSRGSVQKS